MNASKFRTIPEFPGYTVNPLGEVRSARGRVLRVSMNRDGYPSVALQKPNGTAGAVAVHRLIALAFLGPRPQGMEVRHLDGDRTNSVLVNLAYGTSSENRRDTVTHGNHVWANRTHCPRGHEYTEENTYVDPRGSRRCVTCIRKQAREWRRSNRVAVRQAVA